MDMSGLSRIVGNSAPMLGAAIASVNPIAGLLTSLIGHVFGADTTNLSDIATRILADPAAALKLKQLEYEHRDALYQAQVDDRKSARQREEAIIAATGSRDYLLDFIALMVIAGFLGMCVIIVFYKLNSENQQSIYMMFGQLTAGFLMVLSYYFGNSNTNK